MADKRATLFGMAIILAAFTGFYAYVLATTPDATHVFAEYKGVTTSGFLSLEQGKPKRASNES